MRAEPISWHGDPCVRIEGGSLSAVVLPGRGGRIVSLRDRSGREWLEQPVLPLTPVEQLPASFVAGDMCGWDECAPTIDACTVDGRELPDHGDVWDRPWRVDGDAVEVDSPADTYTLRRRIVPDGDGLRLDYRATTALPLLPFLWAAHPQFSAPPGSTVVLPPEVVELIDGEDPRLTRYPVSDGLLGIDAVTPGASRKLFVDPEVRVGRCALRRADGAELRLSWDPYVVPYLGIWYDHAEYSRSPVIALEPMTGYFDVCATALERGRVAILTADEPLTWSITLSV